MLRRDLPGGDPVEIAALAAAIGTELGPSATAAEIAAAVLAELGPNATAADIAAANLAAMGANAAGASTPGIVPIVTVIPATDTVAVGKWSSSPLLDLGTAMSGEIRTIMFLGDKGSGAVLADCFGTVAIFDDDPGLSALAAVSKLTRAQEDMLVGEASFANASLTTDADTFRVTMLTQFVFPVRTGLRVAFLSKGATSFAAAQVAKVKLGIKRYS